MSVFKDISNKLRSGAYDNPDNTLDSLSYHRDAQGLYGEYVRELMDTENERRRQEEERRRAALTGASSSNGNSYADAVSERSRALAAIGNTGSGVGDISARIQASSNMLKDENDARINELENIRSGKTLNSYNQGVSDYITSEDPKIQNKLRELSKLEKLDTYKDELTAENQAVVSKRKEIKDLTGWNDQQITKKLSASDYMNNIYEGKSSGENLMNDAETIEYMQRKINSLDGQKLWAINKIKEGRSLQFNNSNHANPSVGYKNGQSLINEGRTQLQKLGMSEEEANKYYEYAVRTSDYESTMAFYDKKNLTATSNDAYDNNKGNAVKKALGNSAYAQLNFIPGSIGGLAAGGASEDYDNLGKRNRYGVNNLLNNASSYAQEQVINNVIGDNHKVNQEIYQGAMSVGNSAQMAALGGAIGSAVGGSALAAGASEKMAGLVAKGVANVSTLPVFGASAYNSSYNEARDRGLTDTQARKLGTVSALAEMGTEMVSLDYFWGRLQDKGVKATKNILINTLAEAGIEGSEEVASDIINAIGDYYVAGKDGKSQQQIDFQNTYSQLQMEHPDWTRDQLTTAANDTVSINFFKDMRDDFYRGAASGLVFGVVGAGKEVSNAVKVGKHLEQVKEDNAKRAEAGDANAERYAKNPMQMYADYARDVTEEEKARKAELQELADKYDEKGKLSLSDRANAVASISVAANEKYADDLAQAIEKRDVPEQYREERSNITLDDLRTRMQSAANNNDLNGLMEAYQEGKNAKSAEVRANVDDMINEPNIKGLMEAKGTTAEEFESAKMSSEDAYRKGLRGEEVGYLSPKNQIAYNEGKKQAILDKPGKSQEKLNSIKSVSARAVYKEYLNEDTNVHLYNNAWNEFYTAGGTDVEFDTALKNNGYYESVLGKDTLKAIYDAGVENSKEIKLSEANKNTLERMNVKPGNGTFTDIRSKQAKKLDTADYSIYKAFAAYTTSTDVILADNKSYDFMENENAHFDTANSKIYINADSSVAQGFHEALGEWTEFYNSEGYDALRKSLVQAAYDVLGSKEYNETIELYKNAYAGANLSNEDIEMSGEFANDLLVAMMGTEKGRNKLAETLTKNTDVQKATNIVGKVKELFEKLVNSIKSIMDNSDLDLRQKAMLEKGYKELEGNVDSLIAVMEKARENAINAAVEKVGLEIDKENEVAFPKYSIRTLDESDYVTARDEAAKALHESLGVSIKKAKEYIDQLNTVAAIISNNAANLDYMELEGQGMLMDNSEYKKTLDGSTLCKKRLDYTDTLSEIQRRLPNTALTGDEMLSIVNMMQAKGYQTPCGLCYVESTRKQLPTYAKDFLEQYAKENPGKYVPNMAEINTPEGLNEVRSKHREVYDEYIKYMNKKGNAKPKLFQTRAAYQAGEILKFFKRGKKIDKAKVKKWNIGGGMRLQSYSDFEVPQMIDMMQAITDMSRVGLWSQAYTKVPAFADIFGGTGVKINLSTIAKDVVNGELVFDDVEGIDHNEALRIRDKYTDNVGIVTVIFNDEQLKAALTNSNVDYVLPFHRSSWSMSQASEITGQKNLKDYTAFQNEKHPTKKIKNIMPNTYWDFDKTGRQNAEKYLELCASDGRTPKFAFLLNKDGANYSLPDGAIGDNYFKLLIDFKMYNNEGQGRPQTPVRPEFDMGVARNVLSEYQGDHNKSHAKMDIVDKFVKEYKDNNPGKKYSIQVLEGTGISYVNVDIDQGLFDKLNLENKRQMAREVINERFSRTIIGYKEGTPIVETPRGAGEYAFSDKHYYTSDARHDKMRASTELDNLLEVSKFIEHVDFEAVKKRHPEAVNGIDKYKTLFKVGNRWYLGVANVLNQEKVRTLYDVTQIRSIEENEIPTKFGSLKPNNAPIESISHYKNDSNKFSLSVDSKGKKLTGAQQKKFNRTAAVDENGDLLNVYHGTVREFYEFSRDFANVEGNLGKGFYFTNNENDVARNYANRDGADFTSKVEREADLLEGDEEFMDEHPDMEYEDIVEYLKDKYATAEDPITMECYLDIKNPVYIGNYNGNWNTMLLDDFTEGILEEDYEDEDEYYQALDDAMAEKIEDIVDHVTDNLEFFEGYEDVEKLRQVLYEAASEGGATFEQLRDSLEDHMLYDDNYDMANSEVVRLVAEALGYDGIIDNTVSKKFRNMGLSEDTVHFVVFNSNQAKFTTNENPTDSPDVRYSFSIDPYLDDIFSEDEWLDSIALDASSILEKGMESLKGKSVDSQKLKGMAIKLRNEFGSSYNVSNFEDMLNKAFAYMQTQDHVNYEDMLSIIKDIAKPVIEAAVTTEGKEAYQDFVNSLKPYTIKLNDQQKAEVKYAFGSYGQFKNAMMPVRISDNGKYLDNIWNELSELYPNLLPADTTPNDQALVLHDALAAMRPTPVSTYGGNVDEVSGDLAMRIIEEYIGGVEGKKAAELNKEYKKKLKSEYDARLKEAKKAVKYNERYLAAEYRKGLEDKYQDLKQKQNESNEEYRKRLKEAADYRARNAEYNARWKEAENDQRYKERNEKLKQEYIDKQAKLIANNRKQAERARERQAQIKEQKSIRTMANKLTAWISAPSEDNHVPTRLVTPLLKFLNAIDFVEPHVYQKADGTYYAKVSRTDVDGKPHWEPIEGSTRADVIRQVRDYYDNAAGSKYRQTWSQKMRGIEDLLNKASSGQQFGDGGIDNLIGMLDPELGAQFSDMITRNSNEMDINNLSASDLKIITKTMKGIMHAIRVQNKALTQQASIEEMATKTIENAKNVKVKSHSKLGNMIIKNFVIDMFTPETFFDLQGEGGENILKSLNDGFAKKVQVIKATQDYMQNVLKDVSKEDLNKMTGDNAETHTFTFGDGEITLTLSQIMSLYELNKRDQAVLHFRGGIEADTILLREKGIRKEVNQNKPVHLSADDINLIIDTLTDKQKAIADAMQQFMSNECAKWGNEASELMYGYEKFTDPNYFPISADKSTIAKKDSNVNLTSLNGIERMGMTRDVTKFADNALVLKDIFDVFVNHTTDMAAYYGFAPAVKDANRWFNYKIKEDIGNGQNMQTTVQQAVNTNVGRTDNAGVDYYTRLIQDINGSEKSGEVKSFLEGMVGAYKGAAVAGNLRVVIQQPTAIVRAANEIDWKYLVKASEALKPGSKSMDRIREISPLAWWKSQGYYETSMGKSIKEIITGQASVKDRVIEKSMELAGKADDITWSVLYTAVEAEQRDIYRGKGLSAEEFQEKVNERFDSVVSKTQVVDATLQKSQWMRGKGFWNKMKTSFMAEPTKSYNMMLRAMLQDSRTQEDGFKWKKTGKAFAVLTATNLVNAFAQSVIDAMRHKEDDDEYWETWIDYVGKNFLDNMNPFGMVPVVKDVMDYMTSKISAAIKGENDYGSSNETMDMAALSTIVNIPVNAIKQFQGKSNKSAWGNYMVYARGLSTLTGIPVYNVSRDLAAMWNMLPADNLRTNPLTNSDMIGNIKEDAEAGDVEDLKDDFNQAREFGMSDKDIKSKLDTYFKKQYRESDEEGRSEIRDNMLPVYAELDMNAEAVDGMLAEWISESVQLSDMDESIETGEGIKEAIKKLQDAGKTNDKIVDHIMSEYGSSVESERREGNATSWEANVTEALKAVDGTYTYDSVKEEQAAKAEEKAAKTEKTEANKQMKDDLFDAVDRMDGSAGRKAVQTMLDSGMEAKSIKSAISDKYHTEWKEATGTAEKAAIKKKWIDATTLVNGVGRVKNAKRPEEVWKEWEKDQK